MTPARMLIRLMTPIRRSLEQRAGELPNDQVYVEGGWVDQYSSVPTAGGVAHLTRFADACWRENIRLQRRLLEAFDERDQLKARLQPLTSREDMANP